MRQSYKLTEESSIKTVHLFNFTCYFFTFIGGILSDTYFGRFKTILYLSIVYLIGTIITTISSIKLSLLLLWFGLVCISIGTGGIKPCVSTFGGDQYDPTDFENIKSFFNVFYFAINAGSLLSIFISPIISDIHCLNNLTCYPLAFGLPAILLCASLLLFLAGRKKYVKKKPDPKFFKQILECVRIYCCDINLKTEKNEEIVLFEGINNDLSKEKRYEKHDRYIQKITYIYGSRFVDDLRRALEILHVFLLVPVFWMLYDQQSTTWVEQASNMKTDLNFIFFNYSLIPSQMQAFNGVLILLFIPLFTKIIYPFIYGMGYEFNRLTKMFWGYGSSVF
jgi:dipeptide/tripeptide permease